MKVIPEPAVAETDCLVLARLGIDVEVRFLQGLDGPGMVLECPSVADRRRAAELAAQYRDLELRYVDAVLVAIGERLEETTVATLDQRDYRAVRPRHLAAFDIVPA